MMVKSMSVGMPMVVFKTAAINYHSNEKELLALKRSFSKFHFFILPVKFLVRTDNTNVEAYIFNKLPVPQSINGDIGGNSTSRNISLILTILKEKIIILLIFLVGKPIAQGKIAEIHSVIYEEIHPRINQSLAGLDETLSSQQLDMDEDTHQRYLMECKRAHKLEESIKHSSFHLREEETEDKSSTANSDDDFVPILSKATKALKKQAIHEACTLEHYSSYVHWVYTARTTDS